MAQILASVSNESKSRHIIRKPWLTSLRYRYLKALIPLIYIGISLLVLIVTYTSISLRILWGKYLLYRQSRESVKLFVTEADDEDFNEEDEEVFLGDDEDSEDDGESSETTLIDNLPQNTKVEIVEEKQPHLRLWNGAEVLLLAGELALHTFAIIKGEGWRSMEIAGHLEWMYLLFICFLRMMIGSKRAKGLWTHSTLIYLFNWPIAFLLLRSAIQKGEKQRLGMEVTNMCFVSGLCVLVLTTRPGNKPVKLVSTNGLEPTHVPSQFYVHAEC